MSYKAIRLARRILSFLLPFYLAAAAALQTRAAEREKESRNPLAGNPSAIKEGSSLFRANCSPCHGLDARGGAKGPDLTSGRWFHGANDAALFRTISVGLPGTQMPANDFEDSEIWAIIAYLRSVRASTRPPGAGDRDRGEAIFLGKGACSRCHMVNGRGGRLGPDLSRVGGSRSVEYLIDSIRDPSKELSDGMADPNNHYGLPPAYDTVTAVTEGGRRIVGVAKNEDEFSLQLLDSDEQLHLFLKKDLREVVHEPKSLMPAYSREMLSDTELQDLLAYLDSLKGHYVTRE